MFMPYKIGHVGIIPWEEVPAAAGEVDVGMALTLTSGKAGKASGDVTPAYICMTRRTAADGEMIPAIPASADVIFETAAEGEYEVGKAYTIETDGLTVTSSAATSGGATVVSAEDGKVRVRFGCPAAAAE